MQNLEIFHKRSLLDEKYSDFKDLSNLVHAMVVNGAAKKNGAKSENADWLTKNILLHLMVCMI